MRQRWADYRVFWQQFRHAYRTTGAVLPSSKALAAALAQLQAFTNQVQGMSPRWVDPAAATQLSEAAATLADQLKT